VLISLDTNLLVYAEGVDDPARQKRAEDILDILPNERLVISVQVLGELYNVLVRKGVSRSRAQTVALSWRSALTVVETGKDLMGIALELASQHRLRIWDAQILAAASEAGCGLLISEDFQDGFTWGGVTIANPFATPLHPLLANALSE
jgi:predicted nucleic acid-binding protein